MTLARLKLATGLLLAVGMTHVGRPGSPSHPERPSEPSGRPSDRAGECRAAWPFSPGPDAGRRASRPPGSPSARPPRPARRVRPGHGRRHPGIASGRRRAAGDHRPGRDATSVPGASSSSPRSGSPTTRRAAAATGSGRSTTRRPAWPATAWVPPAGAAPRARTSSCSRRPPRPGHDSRIWSGSIPDSTAREAWSSTGSGPIPVTRPGATGSSTRAQSRTTATRNPRRNRSPRGSGRSWHGRPPLARAREQALRIQPPPGFTLSLSERNTPALFGLGQIDAIPSEVLEANAASQPREIRGRLNRSPEGRVGRFGWKAQIASLHEFVRAACASELGLEVPGHSQAASPLHPGEKAKGLDLTEEDCDALVAYLRALPAPVAVDPDGPQGSARPPRRAAAISSPRAARSATRPASAT